MDQTLPRDRFIRISKSFVVNLFKISHFETTFNGTLCVHFKSGRRNMHLVIKSVISSILKMNRRDKK
ncbi:hypothetical protein ERJ70_05135 [Sediminibacillus dalangtanensis]|uniref:HTH LytTR-type domain-containing protein n=1 Tax=Sediminibacillus dalangtanensis TaxID=2729421 RepID=A0ABX7VQF5_9BACI|nr:hypothetical protein ERJ70_05135 [Sediminibacillus dalangtanensis]